MTEERTIDALAVGGIDADLVLTVGELPWYDEKVIGTLIGWMAGGPAANSACATVPGTGAAIQSSAMPSSSEGSAIRSGAAEASTQSSRRPGTAPVLIDTGSADR